MTDVNRVRVPSEREPAHIPEFILQPLLSEIECLTQLMDEERKDARERERERGGGGGGGGGERIATPLQNLSNGKIITVQPKS